jgi:hypothetical protein
MNPDDDAEDPTRKETQEFDPALIDEDGVHPERARCVEPASPDQKQHEKEKEGEQPGAPL